MLQIIILLITKISSFVIVLSTSIFLQLSMYSSQDSRNTIVLTFLIIFCSELKFFIQHIFIGIFATPLPHFRAMVNGYILSFKLFLMSYTVLFIIDSSSHIENVVSFSIREYFNQ